MKWSEEKTGRREDFPESLKQGAIYPLNEIFILWEAPMAKLIKKHSHKHIINQVKGLSVIIGKVP